MEEERNLISVLTKEKNNTQAIVRSLKKIDRYVLEPEFNLRYIKAELKKIQDKLALSHLKEDIQSAILAKYNEINAQVPEWEIEVKKIFGHELEQSLSEAGLELKGDYSHLSVLLYTLEVDLDKLKVIIWFGNKQEKVAITNLDPQKVTQKISSEFHKMKNREFNEDDFLSKLHLAYHYAALKSEIKEGNKVRLSNVLQEFVLLMQGRKFLSNPAKSNFKNYDRIQFTYDLFRLQKRVINGKKLQFITATRAYTKSRMDFMWIPSDEKGKGEFISHITFKE